MRRRLWLRIGVVACSAGLAGGYVGYRAIAGPGRGQTDSGPVVMPGSKREAIFEPPAPAEKPAEHKKLMGGSKTMIISEPKDFKPPVKQTTGEPNSPAAAPPAQRPGG